MKLYVFRIALQVLIVRAGDPAEAADTLRREFPSSDLTDKELADYTEVTQDGPPGIVVDLTA